MKKIKPITSVVKKVFAFGAVLSFVSASNVRAADVIKVNTYTDYPPYLYHEENQQTGLYIKIIDLTFKAINQPYKLKTVPFKRGLHQTSEGDGIMIGILKSEQRMQSLDFSEPFYQERVSVYLNKAIAPLIKTVDKLN